MLLQIENLAAKIEDKEILQGINLEIQAGEVHAIMGPNGSGKSTLTNVLAGRDGYKITAGSINFSDKDLTEYSTEQRALLGLFVAFQYPVEIPGVNNSYFLRSAYNAKQKFNQLPEVDAIDFLKLLKEKMKDLDMNPEFIKRSLNEGFSGGEKKRNEILQLSVLQPKLAILDETDSGLDIDALKIVSAGVNRFKNQDNAVLMITHYQRLLNYIKPDFVHVLYQGKIIKSGNKELALELEEKGYDWLTKSSVLV